MPSPTITFLFAFRYMIDFGCLTKSAIHAVPSFSEERLLDAPLFSLLPMTSLTIPIKKACLTWLPILLDHYYRALFYLIDLQNLSLSQNEENQKAFESVIEDIKNFLEQKTFPSHHDRLTKLLSFLQQYQIK